MPPKTLLRAGVPLLAVGILLYWTTPEWVCLEPYKWDSTLPKVADWLSLSLAGAGGFLLANAASAWLLPRERHANVLRIFPGMHLRNVISLPRHRRIPLFADLPNFGLVCGALLWILLFIFMIDSNGPRYGLLIDLRAHDFVGWTNGSSQDTLGVYLAAGGTYYVNNKPVKREALREALQSELGHRAVWVVYFEADGDALNLDAIYAMDVIRATGARLIWLTPKMRQELQQKASK